MIDDILKNKKIYCFFILINSCEIYKRDIRSPCTEYYCLFKTYLYTYTASTCTHNKRILITYYIIYI